MLVYDVAAATHSDFVRSDHFHVNVSVGVVEQ